MRFTSFLLSTVVPAWVIAQQSCNHDNCLREILATPAASTFCMTYTNGMNTATTGLPSYVSQCQSNPSRISSACSCAVTTTMSTTTTPTPTTSMVCNHDNCLRQILATPAASTFCKTYTSGTQTATTGLPTYVSQCQSNPSRISSACSCAVTPTPISCPPPSMVCNGVCTDVETDTNNCGACNTPCLSGDTCSDGVCSTGQCNAPVLVRRAFQEYCPGKSNCGVTPLSRWAFKKFFNGTMPPQIPLSVKRKRAAEMELWKRGNASLGIEMGEDTLELL